MKLFHVMATFVAHLLLATPIGTGMPQTGCAKAEQLAGSLSQIGENDGPPRALQKKSSSARKNRGLQNQIQK